MNKKLLASYMMAMGMLAVTEPSMTDLLGSVKKPKPTHKKPYKSFDEILASKGLQRFIINDKEIIAHNEREAQKRYNKRYKL